ncbi:MAG: ATP phosphoribosyltransferase [Opitutae bacterium]|nr:ATP phosphoribosyltransferase [Opitutae bacterium]
MSDKTGKLLNFGLPKGSLEKPTLKLFDKAGYNISVSSRSYRPSFDDPELEGRFVRAQEISRFVEYGFFDCGLTGHDWVVENGSDVVEVCELIYSRASNVTSKWVLAVPEDSEIREITDLQDKRIATEVVKLTRGFLHEHGVTAEVEFSWGATEVKVPEMVDAIVDLTETGSSLRANNLRIIDTILSTSTRLIANKESREIEAKREKIKRIALLLQAALEASKWVGLKLNTKKVNLGSILDALPALRKPTISPLSEEDWAAVETIVEDKVVREIIPILRANGAEGIIEYPLNKVVH